MDSVADVSGPGRGMYIIYDLVAEAFVGMIILERHPGPACRTFVQLLGDKGTLPGQHPKDYDLVRVGYIEDSGVVIATDPQTVMTGAAWLSLQESANASA